MKCKVMFIVGARPNFMKVAPVLREMEKTDNFSHVLIHTGQHYSHDMSVLFFEQLNLPEPDVNLGVGSCSHAVQTAEIMKRFEEVLLNYMPDLLLVVGDVNSTVACALVGSKIRYPLGCLKKRPLIGHIEAGLRSFDKEMPEEINRIITDHLSDLLFTTEEDANENLIREGISSDRIYFVGNVMIDTLLCSLKVAKNSSCLKRLGLWNNGRVKPFAVLTLHRASNVDEKDKLFEIISAVKEISRILPVVFPVHPRTHKRITEWGFDELFDSYQKDTLHVGFRGLFGVFPLGYFDFLGLISQAKLVLTDSGGIQEESTILGIPCVTIRNNTERPVTLKCGTNVLAGTRKKNIVASAVRHLVAFSSDKMKSPKLWDGRAARRIVKVLEEVVL